MTCPLCLEPYDTKDHLAKFLPCLHTYCQTCLQRLAGGKPKFKCPNCQGLITLTGGNVESLPNNFIVENLKEYQDIFNHTVICGNCDVGNSAVSFCHDCSLFQCQSCVDIHSLMRSTRNHDLVPLAELKEKICNPIIQKHQHCKKHPSLPLTLLCKNEECKVPSCPSCGLVDHRGHDLVDLKASINDIVADLQQSAAKVESKIQELIRKRALIEANRKTLEIAHREERC